MKSLLHQGIQEGLGEIPATLRYTGTSRGNPCYIRVYRKVLVKSLLHQGIQKGLGEILAIFRVDRNVSGKSLLHLGYTGMSQ